MGPPEIGPWDVPLSAHGASLWSPAARQGPGRLGPRSCPLQGGPPSCGPGPHADLGVPQPAGGRAAVPTGKPGRPHAAVLLHAVCGADSYSPSRTVSEAQADPCPLLPLRGLCHSEGGPVPRAAVTQRREWFAWVEWGPHVDLPASSPGCQGAGASISTRGPHDPAQRMPGGPTSGPHSDTQASY